MAEKSGKGKLRKKKKQNHDYNGIIRNWNNSIESKLIACIKLPAHIINFQLFSSLVSFEVFSSTTEEIFPFHLAYFAGQTSAGPSGKKKFAHMHTHVYKRT